MMLEYVCSQHHLQYNCLISREYFCGCHNISIIGVVGVVGVVDVVDVVGVVGVVGVVNRDKLLYPMFLPI